MNVIPISIIAKHVQGGRSLEGDGSVTIPKSLLRFLLQTMASSADFDEDEYLRANPDVAAAIRQGTYSDAHEHFAKHGYLEGREGGGPAFSELYYLRVNPDVAEAVKAGTWTSGLHHYNSVGRFEWRSPNTTMADEVETWRAMLGTKTHELA